MGTVQTCYLMEARMYSMRLSAAKYSNLLCVTTSAHPCNIGKAIGYKNFVPKHEQSFSLHVELKSSRDPLKIGPRISGIGSELDLLHPDHDWPRLDCSQPLASGNYLPMKNPLRWGGIITKTIAMPKTNSVNTLRAL